MFEPLKSFQSTHLGLFWDTVKEEYQNFEEKSYLPPKIESYKMGFDKPSESWEIPPMPRLWFVSENKNKILQLQQDQLINNWRKIEDEDKYPHYGEIIQKFESHFNNFNTFVKRYKIGEIKPLQYELTYINHISSLNGWEKGAPLENIFPEFKLKPDKKKFLPKYESFNWTNTYLLPNEEGRLYSQIRLVWRKDHVDPLIQFQLRVTGMSGDPSLDKMRGWFDLAHEWIVLSFAELTNEEIQKFFWGKIQ